MAASVLVASKISKDFVAHRPARYSPANLLAGGENLLNALLSSFGKLLPVLTCLLAAEPTWADVALVNNGKSNYRIVIADEAIPSERYAAQELQSYVEKVSGVRLPIVSEAEKPSAYEILLGTSARFKRLGVNQNEAALGPDGFLLQQAGKRLVIAGGKPRGTLNGVYTLLEEKLGVRWYSPELEVCPKTNRIAITRLNERRIPALEYREVFWTEIMRDADFAARHRLNGHHYKLTDKHGGRFAVYQPFVHSFDALVPPGLFDSHPEYFPFIDGKRVGGYVQRCLSNPDVVNLSIRTVRQWIKENPAATIISVSQNDTFKWCQCETCKALDDAEGSPCASLLKFVNTIAEDVERDYPSVRIDTLAYQYTRKPPRTIRPRKNVIIRLCSIECCFAHSIEACPSEANKRFREDIMTWQPVAPLLYVWDYTPNFAHYQQPFPNFDALQPNVRFFVDHGVKGLFEQGNYSPGGMGEMGPLRAYLLAKLLWDPKTDLQKHTREFLSAWYGAAAPGVQTYLTLLQEQVRGTGVHAHIFDASNVAYLGGAFLDRADEILAKAEASATDETTQFRVKVTRLPIWYVKLSTNKVMGDERNALLKEFVAVGRKAGISHISEGRSFEDWAKAMESK